MKWRPSRRLFHDRDIANKQLNEVNEQLAKSQDVLNNSIEQLQLALDDALVANRAKAMSAYADREEALVPGIDDYLQKPVLLDSLKQVIHRWARTCLLPKLKFERN